MIADARAARVAPPLLIALIVLAWGLLIAWGESPYTRFLKHGELDEPGTHAAWAYLALLGVFVFAWALMTAAMMLPTALPLVRRFDVIASRYPDRGRLMALLVAGYLAVWVGVGAALHVFDLGVHLAVDQSSWLDENAWIIGATTLIGAGVYQFTPLKYRCWSQCRSPLTFITSRWHGRHPARDAMRVGLDHGAFCVGCCWSLMLVMFAFGVGNLGWMVAFAAVMVIEKNTDWGRRLSIPSGVALIGVGIVAAGLGIAA